MIQIEFQNLNELLDILWGTRDYCFPSLHLTEQISKLDPNGILCHIQREDYEGKPLETPKVWRVGLWECDYERWKSVKNKSDKENKEWSDLKFDIAAIVNMMDAKSPGAMPRETLELIARKIYETRDVKMLEAFGVRIEELRMTETKLKPLNDTLLL